MLKAAMPRDSMPAASFQFSGGNNVMELPLTARAQIAPGHPLETTLLNAPEREETLQQACLVRAMGPAGPMIRAMELRAANSIGRLPFLQSSNFQRDVLTGRDEEIDFEDVFGLVPRASERTVHPHTVIDSLNYKFNF